MEYITNVEETQLLFFNTQKNPVTEHTEGRDGCIEFIIRNNTVESELFQNGQWVSFPYGCSIS